MYYPYLRGRQNELLALQELLQEDILSERVIPVIEPVKLSPTLINTLEQFELKHHNYILIQNPKVGSFESDAQNSKNIKYLDAYKNLIKKNEKMINGFLMDKSVPDLIEEGLLQGIEEKRIACFCLNPDDIDNLNKIRIDQFLKFVPYAPAFRRIRENKVLIEDCFNKKDRNADYIGEYEDEFFSVDHLYYDGEYVGFSDYSIIGEQYNESGFAPYVVAIHIVYFDEKKELRIHHFCSDDNGDIHDPGGKFYQALEKLVKWNKDKQLGTLAIKTFENIYEAQSYPGLGFIKKLSIMHHLELMSQYLDGEV